MATAFDDLLRPAEEAPVDAASAASTPESDRRIRRRDRRGEKQRRLVNAEPDRRPIASQSRLIGRRWSVDALAAALEPIERLAIAVEALSARASVNASNAEKPTCTVEDAATLLGTTTRGIYALHERGKLPPTVGPGRRLLWRRDDLLRCSRRASSPERDRR